MGASASTDHDQRTDDVQAAVLYNLAQAIASGSAAQSQLNTSPKGRRATYSKMNDLTQDADALSTYLHGAPSMEEVVARHAQNAEVGKGKTPQEVLQELQQGNARFWMGLAQRPEMDAMQRRALIMQQSPKVAILGCSDSRVPIEIIFDQGLGDIFAIRVAGNVYSGSTAASIDYAVNHLMVKVVVVLGHEGCGAVKAAQLPETDIAKEPAELQTLLYTIREGLSKESIDLNLIRDRRARDREAVSANVSRQVRMLSRARHVRDKINEGKLLVIGAFYEISSGMVDFLEQKEFNALLETQRPSARGLPDLPAGAENGGATPPPPPPAGYAAGGGYGHASRT